MTRRVRIPRPVLVFYVSKNSTPPLLRVLWKVYRKDAMRICSDPRSAGRNHMLCWTAYGQEDEDWAFVRDNGKHDSLLRELGIMILESKDKKHAS
jgi:hypothetical protein